MDNLIGPWDFAGELQAAAPRRGRQTLFWLIDGTLNLHTPSFSDSVSAGEAASVASQSVTVDAAGARGVRLDLVLPAGFGADGASSVEIFAPEPFALRSVTTRVSGEARVFAGSMFGQTSPVELARPGVAAELRLAPGAEIAFTLEPTFAYGLLALSDGIAVQNTDVPRGEVGFADAGGTTWGVKNNSEEWGLAVVFGGTPGDAA